VHDLQPTSPAPLYDAPGPRVAALSRSCSRALALPLLLLGALALAACTKDQIPETTQEKADEGLSPQKIASQTILSDEILWSLGDEVQARVVAVSPLVDDPRYSTVASRWPTTLPRLPGSSEALLALDPDLVIIASFTSAETRSFLEAQGVKTLHLGGFDGFDDLWRHTREIAAAVGATRAGERLIQAQKAELAALKSTIGDGPRTPAVAWGEGFVSARGTTFDGIVLYAGLTNLAGERGLSGHASVSVEELVAWDPPVIVIGCEPPRCAEAEREFAARPGIEATRAAREDGVIAIPGAYLSSTGAGMIEAARLLGEEQRKRAAPG